MIARIALGGALAVVWLAAPLARADKSAAKQDVEHGTLAYKLGHFQEALDAFTKAYEAYPAPLLLFDLGQCNRELGNYERAVFFLRGYLHENPKAKNRALVEELVVESQRKLIEQRADAERKTKALRDEQEAESAERLRAATLPMPQPVVVAEVPAVDRTAVEAQASSGRHELYAGAGVAAAGLVAIGVGIFCGARSSSDASTLNQLATTGGTWTTSSQGTFQDGKNTAVAADVLYAVGGTAVVAGGVLALLGWNRWSSASGRLTVAAAPSRSGGQVALAWTY